MSTTIDESIPISEKDFEAQLSSALASLEGRSAAELTDEAIAEHLFEASNDKSEPKPKLSKAEAVFSKIKLIKVIIKGSSKPTADGKTAGTYKCFALSRGPVG